MRTPARWPVQERGHHRLTIDFAAANTAAIRCYRKVGFKPVGLAGPSQWPSAAAKEQGALHQR